MVIDIFREYWDELSEVISMSPLLMLAVFVMVEFISSAFHIKEMSNRWRDSLIGIACVFCGVMVTALAFIDQPISKILHDGILLGSISAMTYQIFKPAYNLLVDFLLLKIEDKLTGENDEK